MRTQQRTADDRIPPQSLEMEQATLGAMLIERVAIEKAAEVLKVEDFYREAHRVIFEAILSLDQRREPVDLLSVQEQLRQQDVLENVGGMPYLVQLTDAVPAAANIEYYARLVKERAILRRLIDASAQIGSLAHSDYEDIGEVIDQAEHAVQQVSVEFHGDRAIEPVASIAMRVLDEAEQRALSGNSLAGASWGLSELDFATLGMRRGDLIVVAARPGVGKSALVTGVGLNLAVKHGQPVAYFTHEMSREQLATRALSWLAQVDSKRIMRGLLSAKERQSIDRALKQLEKAPFHIVPASGLTCLDIRRRARRLHAKQPLGLVVVDYLQIVAPHRRSDNRAQEVAEIARALKVLAQELGVPVIAAAQLSREAEKRVDKRPVLSDLRESGGIEAEADVVLLLSREMHSEISTADSTDKADVYIAKQRMGEVGDLKLGFLPRIARFQDWDYRPIPSSRLDTDMAVIGAADRFIDLPV